MSSIDLAREELRKFVGGFGILTRDEIDTITDGSNIQAFGKGTFLLKEGQIAQHCYFVLKGLVREYYIIDGEERSTAFYLEMDPVNSFTSITSNTPSRHYLQCVEDCVLTVGSGDLIEEMCQRVPRLDLIMREEVERNAGLVQDAHARFVTSSPEERYLHLQDTRPDLLNRVPQHQIASYIGVKPESLSRIRKRLLVK